MLLVNKIDLNYLSTWLDIIVSTHADHLNQVCTLPRVCSSLIEFENMLLVNKIDLNYLSTWLDIIVSTHADHLNQICTLPRVCSSLIEFENMLLVNKIDLTTYLHGWTLLFQPMLTNSTKFAPYPQAIIHPTFPYLTTAAAKK